MACRRTYLIAFICSLTVVCLLNSKLYPDNDIKDDIRIRNAVKTNEATTGHENMETMNVLFLVSDDIRPQMNCFKGRYYPNPRSNLQMHTPNIDYLARKSIVFTQAYVQYAVCGPSRSSYMTGRRPDKTQVNRCGNKSNLVI